LDIFSRSNMIRHLIVSLGLAFLCAFHSGLQAQPVRILTAQADGLDAVNGELAPTDAQTARLAQIAEALRPAATDLLVIDGIPNRTHALKLAALLKPAVYQLAVFSTFPNAGADRGAIAFRAASRSRDSVPAPTPSASTRQIFQVMACRR
jgi:hypothetical protein